MSERIERFEIAGTPAIQVRVASGAVRLTEGDAGKVVVHLDGKDSEIERYRVEQIGDLVQIEPEGGWRMVNPSIRITIETGVPPEVRVKSASGEVTATGELAHLQVDTASGSVRVDRVSGDASIRSASGDVKIGSVEGFLKATVASGDVQAGVVKGGADLKLASGDAKITIAEGGIKMKSASGDLLVGNLRDGDFEAKSLSGDVTVGIPAGRTLEVRLDALSGKLTTEFPVRQDRDDHAADGGVSIISIKTISGDVTLRPVT
ncbi:MAG: DUF4097 domain-containing protein [Actinobacteria bacterium]|jgi:DUF4097 and DUF4098 domain-containing protein YvlB|nr:DUF4097 domain-containing protein [Actinomycetota bacterium]MBU1494599.1 DUF4097 domain-containing protein [Actinomycetota bacterium]